jgi:hypothetical protein
VHTKSHVENTPPPQRVFFPGARLTREAALPLKPHQAHVNRIPGLPLKTKLPQVKEYPAINAHTANKQAKPLDIRGFTFQRILLLAVFLFGFYLVWVYVPALCFILLGLVILFLLIYREPAQEKRKQKLKRIFKLGLKLSLISLAADIILSALFLLLLFFLFATTFGSAGAYGLALLLYPLTLILGTVVVLGLLALVVGIVLLLFAALFRTLYVE